jgi:hypothetical protein
MLLIAGILLLFVFPSILLIPLTEEAPIGNLLLWPTIIAYPASIYFGFKSLRKPKNEIEIIFSGIIKSLIILCILWFPINFLLTGNLSFNWYETTNVIGNLTGSDIMWDYNYFIGGAPFSFILFYGVSRMMIKGRKK